MWLIASYQPSSFFSIRPSNATSSGGKTLLVPTPYAIRMALLDVAIRINGAGFAEQSWNAIRSIRIAISPPQKAIVNNTFNRILKPDRADKGEHTEQGYAHTIGYREYVFYQGVMNIAFDCDNRNKLSLLESLVYQVSYLGKRGGLMQLIPPPRHEATLSNDYFALEESQNSIHIESQLQMVDDCDLDTTWEQVNVYTDVRLKRKQFVLAVPYRLKRTSRNFSEYERIDLKHDPTLSSDANADY